MVNLIRMKSLKRVFHYIFGMRVFLKTAGSRKWTLDNDTEFKREAYQAMDTRYLPH
jgi:hypothetical protein